MKPLTNMADKMKTSGRSFRTSFIPFLGAVCFLFAGNVNAEGNFRCRSGSLYGPFKDCSDAFNSGHLDDGVYSIKPTNWLGDPFDVYCNMTNSERWTVFQRRVDGSVEFYRNWTNYKEGFGELDHEFWLGNDKLYYLTNQGNYTLRIDMVNKIGAPFYAEFDLFRINDESDNYRLSELGNYTGTADKASYTPGGYALSSHLHESFSTFDRDNNNRSGNCAEIQHGAWWYTGCGNSNLNGDYNSTKSTPSIRWFDLPGGDGFIKYTEMKIRRSI